MSSTDVLIMITGLLGGLTFFLFGMNVMSGGLEAMAGGALERTMRKVTSNDFFGFFLGAGITIAIQSSSAMTVMLVGLVNSGIIEFSNTFGMLMGSNVGTTLTAWLLSLTGISGDSFFLTLLQPMTFAPILAFVGIAMRMLSKNDKKKNLGSIFIGFAVLMAGMNMMSSSIDFLKGEEGQEVFNNLLKAFSSPILALLLSTVFTGIIQSSAATIGIIQALALTGAITYEMAIPLVLGANIGTCITAFISSFGTNKNAKRVVVMHIAIKAFGAFICMIALYIINLFASDFMATSVTMIGVAVIHTMFNLATTFIMLPIKKVFISICEKLVPDRQEKKHTVFLDERIFLNTPLAISECTRLVSEMAVNARNATFEAFELLENYSVDKAENIKYLENLTDKYEDKLSTYLVRLSNNNLSETESHTVARLLHGIGDFERIGDHALNISEAAYEIYSKKINFSDSAKAEMGTITEAVRDILNKAVDSFLDNDAALAAHVEPLEQVIDDLRSTLKERHIERLQKGECTVEFGFVYTDILSNYERVADHCSNIAVYTLQMNSDKLDAHKYLNKLRTSDNTEYLNDYKSYGEKYSV